MSRVSRTGLTTLSAGVLTAGLSCCGGELPPNHHQLRSEFIVQLPTYYQLTQFHVRRYTRVGRGDTASFQAPVEAVVRLRTDLYTEHSRYGDTVIVSISSPTDQTRVLSGRVFLQRVSRHWERRFSIDLGVNATEKPGDDLAASLILIHGSSEERLWTQRHQIAVQVQNERRFSQLRSLMAQDFPGHLTVNGGSGVYDFTVRFLSYNPLDETITGEIRFPSLRGAAKEVRGRVSGNNIVVQESSWVFRPPDTTGILFGSQYFFHISTEGRIESGQWQHPMRYGLLKF
jgi:hypothetical protein